MTALDIFTSHAGATLRVSVDEHGETWFVIADIARALDLSNPTAAAGSIESDDLSTTEVIDSMGRTQTARTTNEAGLYQLVFQSRKPDARSFKRWVTREVLPMIRKTGSYGAPALPDISTPEGILALAQQFTRTAEELVAKKNEVAELTPRAAQTDMFRKSDGLRTITDLANDLKVHAQSNYPGLKVHRDDVFDLAGITGLIIRGNTVRNNQPTARAIEAEWVKPKDHTYETNSHGSRTTIYARLTPRGWARLWDAAVTNLSNHGQILPPKKELAV